MSFELVPSKRVLKETKELEKQYKISLLDVFLKLKIEPVPAKEFDVVKVGGSKNTYRVKIGKVRIIYDVYWNEKRIEILKVERRKDRTYKGF